MKKVVYTMEQMQQLVKCFNDLTVTGINNCKLVSICTQIIDSPVSVLEEEEGENSESSN